MIGNYDDLRFPTNTLTKALQQHNQRHTLKLIPATAPEERPLLDESLLPVINLYIILFQITIQPFVCPSISCLCLHHIFVHLIVHACILAWMSYIRAVFRVQYITYHTSNQHQCYEYKTEHILLDFLWNMTPKWSHHPHNCNLIPI